ncbi:MAG: prepilin-type N-terminal cleavage/methylation domain-containing protein [Gammaproteobacteria bacterium]|nr:prepilin-type N-terminal cleavage/methylation domain-containing protein [Gammaproteobacteria bacterium]
MGPVFVSGGRGSGGDGFTLVEVVVALSILSLVMLATITGLRTLANTQLSLERMTDRVDGMRAVSGFLRDTLESAAVGGGGGLSLGGGSRGSAYFEMAPDGLAWKSTILIGEYFGGSYLLRVAREDDLLVLRWQEGDASGQPGDWSEAQARTLVEGLQDFEVSWREDSQGDWRQQWQKGDKVGWVRLQVKAADRYWPELIMQVPQ